MTTAAPQEKLPFVYPVSALARSLVLMPGDSQAVFAVKLKGFYVSGEDINNTRSIVRRWGDFARDHGENPAEAIKKELLGEQRFDYALVLSAYQDDLLNEVGITDEELRASLYKSAEDKIRQFRQEAEDARSHNKLVKAQRDLGVPIIREDEIKREPNYENEIRFFRVFQDRLLERVTPTSPDISRR